MTPRFLLTNLVRLAAKRELRFEFDRIPLVASHLPPRKILNLFGIGLNRVFGFRRIGGWPYMAHVSPAGACNLQCPLCPAHDPDALGKGLLQPATFRKLVDEAGDRLIYIILWSWGEPLLNPGLEEMARYAADRGILTVTSTNLDRLEPGREDRIVASGLDALIVALDGVDEATHGRLRPGGSAVRVIENIRRLKAARDRSGGIKPLINLRMVVSRENEDQIDAYRALARNLGVDMVSFKAFSTRQPGYCNPEADRRFAPRNEKYRWYRYRPGFIADPQPGRYKCRFPWTKPTLFADGTIAACEFDFHEEWPFGNLNERSFREIWFGPRAGEFRRRFHRDRDSAAFCRDCVYDFKRFPGCVVDWELFGR